MSEEFDHILSELSDSAFELPALEFEDDVGLDEALVPSLVKQKRDILIEVDEKFKKVVTLYNEDQALTISFRRAIYNDPGLRHYSDEPFKFQIFSQKFNTWVDLDHRDIPHLKDGTHLKALFLNNDKSLKHSKHKHKSRRRDDSPYERKRKRRSVHKRERFSSDDEYEKYTSGKPRKSYSSNEGHSYINPTVPNEPIYNSPYRTYRRKVSDNYCDMKYNLCSISSTFTVSATNYVVSSKHVKSEVCNDAEDDIEEGEMRDEDDDDVGESFDDTPANEGEVYRLSLGLEGKHPISALHELCTKLGYERPVFETIEEGYMPDPQFLMQVTVQGIAYIPDTYARRKKEAKKLAAEYCLKKLGFYE